MSLPSSVLNQINLRAPKGIVYGPPGVGKTTFGAGSGGLIVDTENGAAHMQCDRTPYLPDWKAIEQWLNALAAGGHEYGAIVIDSVDWLLQGHCDRHDPQHHCPGLLLGRSCQAHPLL